MLQLKLINGQTLASWFERAASLGLIRRTDFQVAAMTVLCALHGPAMLTGFVGRHPTGHSRVEYVDAVVDLILEGLTERTDEHAPPMPLEASKPA
ncbi:MAG: TetR/AcrR family transcriptional regulator C-terminal domain-containing protein [Planctomycetaceae bacterium]